MKRKTWWFSLGTVSDCKLMKLRMCKTCLLRSLVSTGLMWTILLRMKFTPLKACCLCCSGFENWMHIRKPLGIFQRKDFIKLEHCMGLFLWLVLCLRRKSHSVLVSVTRPQLDIMLIVSINFLILPSSVEFQCYLWK